MMNRSAKWLGLAMTVLLACPALTLGETAQEAFAKGQKLLAKGDFQGALAAYSTAAQADRENQEYLGQYALVRRVVRMREQFEQEQDPARWEYLAQALHSFYVSQRLYQETAAVDRQIHSRLKTAASAMLLAETLLAMDQSAEAAKVLGTLKADEATPSSRALLGVALAGLVACLESLAPSRQGSFQRHARSCPDFDSLRAKPEFAKALATESKVPESQCSGGKSCAGCPMRGQCAHGQKQ